MIETAVERLIFMSRWIMAPIYLGLVLVLGVLMVKFMEELYHFVPHVLDLRETDVILMTLTLLDISLAASLVLMMIFSGYENFVSKIDTGENDRPAWMGKLDFGAALEEVSKDARVILSREIRHGILKLTPEKQD